MEEHFSIAEAAAELHMTEAAVLRACLDEQLDLSIRFSGRNLPHGKLRRQLPMEVGYAPKRVKTATLGLYDMTVTLGSDRSLWTLVMAGSGRLCVEDEYQKAIGKVSAVSDSSPSSRLGVFVSTPDVSMPEPGYVMLYELVEYRGTAAADAIRYDEDFHSARALPAGSEMAISKRAITAFQAKRSINSEAPKAGIADVAHKPNWDVWRHALKATLRDAICLSCDANPSAVPKDWGELFTAELLPQLSAGKEARSEISRRLQIAKSHVGMGGTLPTVNGDKDGDVYLAAFSEWALTTMKWPVPDEFRALASTDQHSHTGAPETDVQVERIQAPARRPLSQQAHQEAEILRVIRELGHDPKKLPKPKSGKPGVKAAACKVLNWQGTIFDKAWERLRSGKEIIDA
jgi:hypothetical protein